MSAPASLLQVITPTVLCYPRAWPSGIDLADADSTKMVVAHCYLSVLLQQRELDYAAALAVLSRAEAAAAARGAVSASYTKLVGDLTAARSACDAAVTSAVSAVENIETVIAAAGTVSTAVTQANSFLNALASAVRSIESIVANYSSQAPDAWASIGQAPVAVPGLVGTIMSRLRLLPPGDGPQLPIGAIDPAVGAPTTFPKPGASYRASAPDDAPTTAHGAVDPAAVTVTLKVGESRSVMLTGIWDAGTGVGNLGAGLYAGGGGNDAFGAQPPEIDGGGAHSSLVAVVSGPVPGGALAHLEQEFVLTATGLSPGTDVYTVYFFRIYTTPPPTYVTSAIVAAGCQITVNVLPAGPVLRFRQPVPPWTAP